MSAMFIKSLTHALMITGFVFVMMLVIEYLNVLSQGLWKQGLRGSRWKQYLLAAFLGATPGCMGAFAVVALYSHRTVSLGALVTAMIATSGDESFVMLTLIPGTAGVVFLLLLLVGLTAGILTDLLLAGDSLCKAGDGHEFVHHQQGTCNCFPRGQIAQQWRNCTLARAVLVVALALFVFGLLTGQLGPQVWNWIRITLLLTSAVGLFIVATVPDHFLERHLWQHVARQHVPRIFAWTFGALLLMHLLVDQLQLGDWMQANRLLMLLAACVVGLVPESGPHLVFLTLYTQGAVPFSVLLASSIVQDGHGMLPLLADSRRDFFQVKAINLLVGLLAGMIGFFTGW
ncbi:Putative, 10TM heavy-metal exporter [Malonomonas rubra DSM 5091]|uniref:Putative, 10TM heavy-metal exporter n=1 Tax=Malonomonas rubra DSM 5091 TaxID=1122189 RepID=A0A1M6NFH7_MALRU|nr:putative manganese transporter [Malonomonas rubra]SHJ94346.1 Putative, 10TM heavy-metal exporter [Malonomonas rubra DSM 5091]